MILPFKSSYWVIKNHLIAGEIPTSVDANKSIIKLNGLISSKVKAVINLMELDEKDHDNNLFFDYTSILEKANIDIYRFPIKDMDVPSPVQMMRILKQIEYYNKRNELVYLHCWGGLGRTGTVVGCYLLMKNIANKNNVLKNIIELKKNTPLSNKKSPQTTEQAEFILNWI